jgi:hypothetical protein
MLWEIDLYLDRDGKRSATEMLDVFCFNIVPTIYLLPYDLLLVYMPSRWIETSIDNGLRKAKHGNPGY